MPVFASYTPRHSEDSLLYGVVAENLESFLAAQQAKDRAVPAFVEKEFRSFLRCGVLEFGFLRLRCESCGKTVEVAQRVAVRVAALFEKKDRDAEPEEPALAALYGASITGAQAMGPHAGQRVKTAGDFQLTNSGSAEKFEESFEHRAPRCALVSGFSVHAGVGIRAEDRKGLERLLRYAARPPVAADRLAQLPNGSLSYELKTPWKNGTTHVIFDPVEFLGRLAALVPFPRKNLVRFHGIFGPAAAWRAVIVPAVPENDSASEACECDASHDKKKRRRNYSWSELMRRVFEFDVLKCGNCNGKLKILAAIHPPINTRKILECMGVPGRAPPIAPAVSESTF